MSSTEPGQADKDLLLDIARQSIQYGLQHHTALPVKASDYSAALQQQRATFVTLNLHQQLRGCIGTLQAYQPLVCDVAEHAYAAAFNDPRFSPVTPGEEPELEIHISILTPATAIEFSDETDLLRQIQPGTDGLILESGYHKGTFLPSVWESLPDAEQFLRHLKQKAGLPANFWSNDIKIYRYHTVSIP
ncbi:MAG: AmmeMemoRadiSam system protein A [Gammaproteobacteria bacterium]|nr:AmmeMemoRadiSam system protein A [Gammaproteobacteria bacterium]